MTTTKEKFQFAGILVLIVLALRGLHSFGVFRWMYKHDELVGVLAVAAFLIFMKIVIVLEHREMYGSSEESRPTSASESREPDQHD